MDTAQACYTLLELRRKFNTHDTRARIDAILCTLSRAKDSRTNGTNPAEHVASAERQLLELAQRLDVRGLLALLEAVQVTCMELRERATRTAAMVAASTRGA